MMKTGDTLLLLAHAYILGSWFQDDLVKMTLMLIAGLVFAGMYFFVSQREIRWMEQKFRSELLQKEQELRLESLKNKSKRKK